MSALARPLLLGHRGARAVRSIPENTIESFDRALADGCDGFEFDVRVTADGQAVICHDPHFAGINIATASTQQLPNFLRLEDVLCRYQQRAFLDIELKVSGLERLTLELLQKFAPRRGVVVSSFLPEVLLAMRDEEAPVPLGFICDNRNELLRWRDLPVDFVIPQYKLASASVIQELHAAGKKIFVWTVNTGIWMTKFRDLGVDGIISDHTRLLCTKVAPGETNADLRAQSHPQH